MADAVITLAARRKMVRARAGEISLPPIVGMVFGTSGVDAAGVPVTPAASDAGLKNEVFRKPIDGYKFIDNTTCCYSCTLNLNECVNESINEIGLYDSEGDVIAIKTFRSKGKDADVEMTFQVEDIF